ncbi:MAG: hypothetical protein WC509_03855 [Candidatus Izemoplasmatales bacterium]
MKKLILFVCMICLSFLHGCFEISTHMDTLDTSTTVISTSSMTTSFATTQSSEITTTFMKAALFGEPGVTPEIFAPGFISTETNFEFAGTFSPDYRYYFFTRRAPEGANRIFYSEYIDGQWSHAELSPISEDVDEFEPFITPDGKMVYFGSMRDNRSDYAIYQSEFANGAWQTPTYCDNGLNSGFSMYVTVSTYGNIYFTGLNGIYVIKNMEGEFQSRVSTGIAGAHPYISPDESYMLFDRESGSSRYIYITIQNNGHWSTPVKLGSDINQSGAEQLCPSVTTDGKYFFFSRFIEGVSNIYWVDASCLDQYLD